MKVDQSMITGESDPIEVQLEAADPDVLEAKNVIFNGSLVVDGQGIGMAIRTGDATLIGGNTICIFIINASEPKSFRYGQVNR